MESTSLAFPLTGEYSKNPLTLSFQPNSSNKASIQLEGSSINFSGNNEALFQATSYFFREKHWSFGGHFGSWENRRKTIPSEEELFHLEDRKSTRLNSSHVANSYAVFCLKKKKKIELVVINKKLLI